MWLTLTYMNCIPIRRVWLRLSQLLAQRVQMGSGMPLPLSAVFPLQSTQGSGSHCSTSVSITAVMLNECDSSTLRTDFFTVCKCKQIAPSSYLNRKNKEALRLLWEMLVRISAEILSSLTEVSLTFLSPLCKWKVRIQDTASFHITRPYNLSVVK
jgi:hypothetical protein